MRVKVMVVLWLIIGVGLCLSPRSMAGVFLHEFLADPAAGQAGDANQDGVRDSAEDEFIELFNSSSQDFGLGGWYITDAANTGTVRHVFAPGAVIAPRGTFVVFGGGQENLFADHWVTASEGTLALNNGGDTITLYDDLDRVVDVYAYGSEAGDNQSIVRSPEGSKGAWIKHARLPSADGQRFSPGALVNDVDAQPKSPVPEPATLMSLILGLASMAFQGRR